MFGKLDSLEWGMLVKKIIITMGRTNLRIIVGDNYIS